MSNWVGLASLPSDSRPLSSANAWLLYLWLGIRLVLLEFIRYLLVNGIEIFLLAIMVGEVISIVDPLQLRMPFQLSRSYQGFFLDDIHVDRLRPIMNGNPHIFHLIRC
jgi:hypothetical protein